MEKASLGELELAVLRWIGERAPVAARDVIEAFAESHGLARSTVLTVIERLRTKGFVSRRRREGVYEYSPRVQPGDLVNRLVGDFIEKTLGGSVSPLLAYLAQARNLTEKEHDELERLLEELRAERPGARESNAQPEDEG